ncbi:MAG: cobalt transporter [Rickettsiales bacterium]|nr:cobalt transporter [Rickettsiales bacterium]
MKNYSLKKFVFIVGLLNILYFFIEFTVALNIKSVSLFGDSIDFLEDASVNFLIFYALYFSLEKRVKVSITLAIIMLFPGLATIWAVWNQILTQEPPDPFGLSLVGLGALIVNCICALLLSKFKNQEGSLSLAAFLSARNDAFANILVILTGFFIIIYPSIWPDILVGIGIAIINANAAFVVYRKAREEQN